MRKRFEKQVMGVSKTVTRMGFELCYRVFGQGLTVVLVPSLGRGSEDFDVVAPLIASAGLQVLLPEPRGIGGSSPLQQTDTLSDMAADVAAIIEAESAGPAVLAGHAAGNWVARVLAYERPDLTRSVALLAAIVTNVVPADLSVSISKCHDLTLPEAERLALLKKIYFAPGADASVWLGGWWPDVSADQRRAARQTIDKTWIRVADKHPTLYLAAAQDVISPPPSLDALRDTIGPKASSVVISDAGHALLPEQPEQVAQALLDWISDLPSGPLNSQAV